MTPLRPPGGTHIDGPFEDMTPTAQDVTLAPGESYTLHASRQFTVTDATGSWEAYFTYEDAGGYQDQPSTFFDVIPDVGRRDVGFQYDTDRLRPRR